LNKYCICADLKGISVRQHVVVVWHHSELERRRGSNTAKLLVQFGADSLVWGVKEHEEKLRLLLEAEREHSIVLFPAPGATEACEMARGSVRCPDMPRVIIVLDGSWKETRQINQSIDQRVVRVCVSSATRDEYGGTRKYRQGKHGRVQTAAAFVALMKELAEDDIVVAELHAGLQIFLAAFDEQLRWSGVDVAARTTPPANKCVQRPLRNEAKSGQASVDDGVLSGSS
jgi:DTW domain-containing protein YfiP